MYMTEKLNKLRQVKDSVFKHDVSKESSPLLFKPSYIHKEKIDNIIKNKVIEMKELCEMYPNDADLGKEIRKIAMSIKKNVIVFIPMMIIWMTKNAYVLTVVRRKANIKTKKTKQNEKRLDNTK